MAAWALADAGSGELLAQRSGRRRFPVASATKLMTAYVALQDLRPSQAVSVPAYRAAPGESLMGLQAGARVSVRELLYGLLLASGNDAAVALAEAGGGSSRAFVARMNAAARRLGLRDTRYADAIGLDPGNASSAADLVALARILLRRPLVSRIVDTPAATVAAASPPRLENRNDLVHEVRWVDGVKTGYTDEAGYVLVASGTRHGVQLLAAVVGADSESARDRAALDLLEYGLSLYRNRRPVERGARYAGVGVRFGDEPIPLVADRSVEVFTREAQRVSTDVRGVPTEVEGPVRRGEELGRIVVRVDGKPTGRAGLVAARAVAAPSLFDRVDDRVPGGRGGVWAALGALAAAVAVLGVLAGRALRPRRG